MANSVLAKMAVQISANTAEFNKRMAETSAKLNDFQKTANNVNTSLNAIGFGFGAFQGIQLITDAVNRIKDFGAEVSQVKAITGATSRELELLRNKALLVGQSTKFTAKEVASLQVVFGRLGFTTKEILNATEATVQLAVATGEDLAKSADVAGATLRGFGIDASQTQRVVDVMARSFNYSALGLENFSEAMKYVAPVAASAGLSLEQTTALLGVLADNGIRGSMAGTSLRKIISDLGKGAAPVLNEKLKEMAAAGLSGADAMDEVGRTAYASLLILSKNTEKIQAATKAYNEAAGAGKRAADIMQDNLAGSLTKLSSAYDTAIISSTPLTQGLKDIVDVTTRLLSLSVQEGSGIFKFLNLLVSYTPNIVTLSRILGKLIPDAKEPIDQLKDSITEFNKLFQGGKNFANPFTQASSQDAERYAEELKKIELQAATLGVKLIKLKDEATGVTKVLIDPRTPMAVAALAPPIDTVTTKVNNLGEAVRKVNMAFADLSKIKVDPFGTENNITENRTPEKTPTLFGSQDLYADMMDRLNQRMKESVEGIKNLKSEFEGALIDLGPIISDFAINLAEGLGQAISGTANFGKSFIKAVAVFMGQLGRQMIAVGIAKKTFDKLLAVPGGGAALVAAGIALSVAASAVSGTFRAGYGGGGGTGSGVTSNPSANFSRSTTVLLDGQFRIEGRDLVYIVNKNNGLDSKRKG